MELETLLTGILNSWPYPVLFVDCDHIIRYMNERARYHYYVEKGCPELIGKSLLECHDDQSRAQITAALEKLKNNSSEIFIGVNEINLRMYITPVRDEAGELIGYYERFEPNHPVKSTSK